MQSHPASRSLCQAGEADAEQVADPKLLLMIRVGYPEIQKKIPSASMSVKTPQKKVCTEA